MVGDNAQGGTDMPRPGTPEPPRQWGTGLDQLFCFGDLTGFQENLIDNGFCPRKYHKRKQRG